MYGADKAWHKPIRGSVVAVKSIVILANSYKNERRCIAGKEVHKAAAGRWRLTDDWYRPVTTHTPSHGAISLGTCTDRTTRLPFRLLDIVEIDFDAPAPEPGQPENWTFNARTPWSRVGHFRASVAVSLLDNPIDIWDDPESANKSLVTETYSNSGLVEQSLLLIQPAEFRLHLSNDHNPWQGHYQKKMKASFSYNETTYDGINVTDPAILDRYANSYPAQGDCENLIALAEEDGYSLCISLAPPFPNNNNTQSKLLAAVISQS